MVSLFINFINIGFQAIQCKKQVLQVETKVDKRSKTKIS